MPVVIVTNSNVDYINGPCNPSGPLPSGSSGGSSGSSGSSTTGDDDDARTGPAITGTGPQSLSITRLRLTNSYEGWQDGSKSEIHYRISLVQDATNANSPIQMDEETHPKGFKLWNVAKSKISNQDEIAINEPLLVAWDLTQPNDKPYILITIFEYDWYAGKKTTSLLPAGINGVSVTHEYRAKFNNEIFYNDIIAYTDPFTNTFVKTSDFFQSSNDKIGLCSSCMAPWNTTNACYSSNVGDCSADFIQIEQD